MFQCHELLSRIYERRHEYAEALAHFRIYHDLEREKHNVEIEARLASIRVEQQVDTAKKDAEIQRLRNLALQREVRERKVAQAKDELTVANLRLVTLHILSSRVTGIM